MVVVVVVVIAVDVAVVFGSSDGGETDSWYW